MGGSGGSNDEKYMEKSVWGIGFNKNNGLAHEGKKGGVHLGIIRDL